MTVGSLLISPNDIWTCGCESSVRFDCILPSSDDDLSEQSSGCETPASSSSRHDLDADEGKKKKKKKNALKKKEKKSKGKKKSQSVEDLEKKTKKKGFGLLR